MIEPRRPAAATRAAGDLARSAGLRAFGAADATILVRGADPLLPYLPMFLGGWRSEPFTDERREPDIDIIAIPEGFLLQTPDAIAGDTVFADAFEAANGLAGILAGAMVAADPETLCLHSAAAEIGPGAVLLLGDSMSGKSSVSLQLAAAGYRLFGDDRVGLRASNAAAPASEAVCLGLLPKVRLPVPVEAGERFAELVRSHTNFETSTAAYLGPTVPRAARLGDSAPVQAIVLLDRRAHGRTRLEDVSAAALAQTIIRRAYAPHLSGGELVRLATRIVGSVVAKRLSFAASADAALLLEAVFVGEDA